MKKLLIGTSLILGAAVSASAQAEYVELTHVELKQNPQDRLVVVKYTMTNDTPVYVTLGVTTNNGVADISIPDPVTVWGAVTSELSPFPVKSGDGVRTIYWDAKKDWPSNLTDSAQAVVTAWFTGAPPASLSYYVVVDLSEGPGADGYPHRYSITPPVLSDPACKTTELWLRRIPAGTFTMGSPEGETGRVIPARETQHEVTLPQDFYIGVFEVTQKQWELVMGGGTPALYPGDTRPVERVSYDMIRGATNDTPSVNWPATKHDVNPDSFMGRLRARTPFLFDLPTDAQWEYACRAGTTNALNNGKDLTATGSSPCPNMNEVGRYTANTADGKGGYAQHTAVGLYRPNDWGLYDMHGNVWEWCLDWMVENLGTSAVSNPVGPNAPQTGMGRIGRGGSWANGGDTCRSAFRNHYVSERNEGDHGFRVVIQP